MDILNIFKEKKGTGANIDPRPVEEQLKDYKFEEIVASVNPVNWVEKPQSQWRKFPIFNQNGSGSCVAQTMAKLLGVMYWLKNGVYVHFSATHIYQRRSNRPASGMWGIDALDIARKGVTLEVLAPSQNMTDAQMDSAKIETYKQEVGEIFKIDNYLVVGTKDIDKIASIIQTTGKAVMVWFYFEDREWTARPVVMNPNLDLYASSTARHSVTAVDYTLVDGKKALIIEDSWGSSYGLAGQRIIDEDFFKARNWFAAYPMSFVFDEQQSTPVKPSYTFNTDLVFGMTNNDVKALQDCLKYEGLFPTNAASTGYFGAITKTAVQKFQDKYNIAVSTDPGYGRVGPRTRAKLNEIY
jgi:hypothetical protein